VDLVREPSLVTLDQVGVEDLPGDTVLVTDAPGNDDEGSTR
jgi:hypothetical protein